MPHGAAMLPNPWPSMANTSALEALKYKKYIRKIKLKKLN